MAAAGVRSSGAGLEVVPFSSPVVAIGRFESWVRDIDRQLMSAIAQDVETATVALRHHGKAGVGPWRPALLYAGTTEITAGGSKKVGIGVQPRPEAIPSLNRPTASESPAGDRNQPSVQAQLLARSAHWTAAVEVALSGTALGISPSQKGDGSSDRGGETSDALRQPERMLQEILSSILLHVSGWTEDFRQPGGMIAYNSVSTTALVTQALQQRDVLEELLKTASSPLSATMGSAEVRSEMPTTPPGAPSSLPTTSSTMSSLPRDGESANLVAAAEFAPFLWTCHLRHYYTPQEALAENGLGDQGSSKSGRDEDQEQELVPPPPPPLIRVGIGPWNVPYGLEYAGTLERLWLTPLSERCLLHAVHSAKV